MPHGSGGGSHSGGSHSSHHSSSHRSSHRSGSSRMSSRRFHNSRKYRYYDRHGREHYVYSNTKPRPQSPIVLVIIIAFMFPFIFSGIGLLSSIISELVPPQPLKQDYAFNGVYIEDNANVFNDKRLSDDTQKLNKVLKEFKEKTGIAPYIITVHDSDWQGKYDSLENYAYSLYVNRFSDEKHFVVVYSEPENAEELEFVNWSWEGMQGDYTDNIITRDNFKKFQSDLQKYLSMDNVSVAQAFTYTFKNSLDYMMLVSPEYEMVVMVGAFAFIWCLIIFTILFAVIRNFIKSRRHYEEVAPDNFNMNGNYY